MPAARTTGPLAQDRLERPSEKRMVRCRRCCSNCVDIRVWVDWGFKGVWGFGFLRLEFESSLLKGFYSVVASQAFA